MTAYREVRIDPRDPLAWQDGVSCAVRALENGEILVHPTSTVYGIGAAAVEELDSEINRLKGRTPDRRLIRLAGSAEAVRRALPEGAWDDRAEALAAEFWPGPLTLVFDDGTESGLAIRVDGHPVLLVVLGRWRSLMSSTSLNREGEPPASERRGALEVLDAMPSSMRPVFFLEAGSLPTSEASTIVSLRGEVPEILREGPFDRRRISRCLGRPL